MVSSAMTDHAAHVQQVKLIAALQTRRNIADKTLQRATTTENTEQQVAGIDLRESPCRQLEQVVGGAVSQSANDDHIAGLRRTGAGNERDRFGQAEWRCCRADLVDVDDVYFRVH